MATKAVYEVRGGARLRRTLRQANSDLADLKDVHAAVANYVATRAAQAAPRRTGALAGSVRGNRAASKAVVRAGRASVPYAVYVHWGTRLMGARPFISITAQNTQPSWLAMYNDGVEQALSRVRGA